VPECLRPTPAPWGLTHEISVALISSWRSVLASRKIRTNLPWLKGSLSLISFNLCVI
jgi:hypothetical protein